MWVLLVVPVAVVGLLSVVALARLPPRLKGHDPAGLRTVVEWRDNAAVAADVAGDPHEQLRQLLGMLAEKRFILSSSIDRGGDRKDARVPVAGVDVRERRFELRVRTWRGGRWLMWIDERQTAPDDSDDLRQLLTGFHRTLEARHAEAVAWHRRENFASGANDPAPTPFRD
jgi:hypothetical protein